MKISSSLIRFVVGFTIATLLTNPLWAQDELQYTPLEVRSVKRVTTRDLVLGARFNDDRPFLIAVNQKIPNARNIRDTVVQSLGQKRLLEKVVFTWFGETPPEAIEVKIGVNVPLAISQSVLRALSTEKGLPLIVSLYLQDKEFWYTQQIIVGSLTKSGSKPIPDSTLDALLSEQISREEFLRIFGAKKYVFPSELFIGKFASETRENFGLDRYGEYEIEVVRKGETFILTASHNGKFLFEEETAPCSPAKEDYLRGYPAGDVHALCNTKYGSSVFVFSQNGIKNPLIDLYKTKGIENPRLERYYKAQYYAHIQWGFYGFRKVQ